MTLEEALEELKRGPGLESWEVASQPAATILQAAASGELIAKADARLAEAREVKPLVFVEGRHLCTKGRTLQALGVFGKVEVTTGWENGKVSAHRSYAETEWFATEDEAIAFLQADYQARILSALKGTP